MKLLEAQRLLQSMARDGRTVFTTGDLARLFCEPRSAPRLNGTLVRLVDQGILVRPTRGVYVFADAAGDAVLHNIASAARRGLTNVESYETALSRWGYISQTYPRLLTVATTGREGMIRSPWGTVELIHTSAEPDALLAHTVPREGLLPLMDAETSLRFATRARRKALDLVREMEGGWR